MKNQITLISVVLYLMAIFPGLSTAQEPVRSPADWAIIASYTIPGKASGLAWDGSYIYFGIYGVNGSNIYKFNPADGTNVLQCAGSFDDAYGLTYKAPNLVTINQPSSSSQPSDALEFTLSGSTVSSLPLPDHYMSGIAWDNGNWWVCTYYPDNGTIYNLSETGAIISQFTPPANQPWDICKQGSSLWIADYYANMLYKVTTTGSLMESHASAGQNPSGVVYDGTYLWYCDGALGSSSTLYKIDLTGMGTPEITVPVTTHDFGSVAIGAFSTWNCVVQNTGTANLSITNIEIPAGQPITSLFSVPQTIAPGNSLMVPLKFTPTLPAILNTQVTIHSSDPIHPEVSVTLLGNGVYQGPHIILPENSHNYGVRRSGAFSKCSLPITNDGNQNVVISDLSTNNEHFFVDESVVLPITITSLNTAEVPIWFHPTEGVYYNGVLSISSNAVGQETVFVDLDGSGEDTLYPVGTPLWSFDITGGFDNSPKSIVPVADITGDGIMEVIVGSEDNVVRCFNGNASVTGDVLWEKPIYSGAVYQQNCISAISDINADGFGDIIVGTAWGDESIIALSGKNGQQLWKHDTHEYGDGGWVYQVDSRFDYNSDGFPDVLASTGDDGNDTGPLRVYCLNGLTGISIWERPLGGAVFSVIGVEDFTGDALPDVVAGTTNLAETEGRVVGLNGSNGSVEWTYNTTGSSVWGLMQLDDITGDDRPDIAAGDFSGKIVFLNAATGSKIHDLNLGSVLILRLVDIGDANKNGFRDILVAHSGNNGLVVDGNTCTYIWTKPLSDKSWCVANIGDITWDGTSDAIIGTLYQNNQAYFLNGSDGTTLSTYPSNAEVDALNAIPDITGDNSMEMLFGDRNGLLTCLSGGYDSTTISVSYFTTEAFNFLIYPNPNEGLFGVRMISNEKTDASFRLMDLQGRVVQEFPDIRFDAGVSNVEFNLTNGLVPGLYFLEAMAQYGYHREKLILK
ncbi:MAG: choice-of-anchor D domain-containing protein [Bacteroidota bacterium]